MKAGLNVNDINTLKRGLEQGLSTEEIARICRVDPVVMKRYADSLKPKRKKATDVNQD